MTPELLEKLQTINDDSVTHLLEPRDLRPAWHRWSQREIDAVTLALAAERPLLLRGEPGAGKTQLARAAANLLGWRLHIAVIHARFEASDLFYRFDAVKRLADAQTRTPGEPLSAEDEYLSPGPLWQALDWDSAKAMKNGPKDGGDPPGHVLLLDEIDKADTDLANSLLDALGSRRFQHPYGGHAVGAGSYPLVVVTTNEDREMPAPFLRRCIVLDMDVAEDADYAVHLCRIAEAHFGELPGRARLLDRDIIEQAAGVLLRDRLAIGNARLQPPGVAEMIDLLTALLAIAPGVDAGAVASRKQWLERLSDYALRKYQGRSLPAELRQRAGAAQPAQA